MAALTPGKPVETDQPTLTVQAKLPVGTHRFSLVVVDDQGRRSAPASIEVVITRQAPGKRKPDGIRPMRPT